MVKSLQCMHDRPVTEDLGTRLDYHDTPYIKLRPEMAEAPNLYAESLEKLDQELTCPICLKHFEEPKVLQCCHYYCRECIVQLRARTRGKSDYFQCPECRMEIRLPGDDPER